MLDFAVRLTREPGSFTARDLEGLRRAGFDQEAIVSIVLITCLFNFMNRLATGFAVEVPPGYRKVVESWLNGPAAQESWLLPPAEFQSDESPADRLGLVVPSSQQKPAGLGPFEGHQSDSGEAPFAGEQQGSGDDSSRTNQHETGRGPSPEDQRDIQKVPSRSDRQDSGADASHAEQDSAENFDNQGPREDMQRMERFISECCTVASDESTTARDLYISYLRWCDDNGEHALLQ